MSIEQIVKEVSEAEIERYRPAIKAKVQQEVAKFISSASGKRLIREEAEALVGGYLENVELTEILSRRQINRVIERAFKV